MARLLILNRIKIMFYYSYRNDDFSIHLSFRYLSLYKKLPLSYMDKGSFLFNSFELIQIQTGRIHLLAQLESLD